MRSGCSRLSVLSRERYFKCFGDQTLRPTRRDTHSYAHPCGSIACRFPCSRYEIFLRTTRFMTQSEAEVQKAFIRCVFNVCMHNRDDHTKNFAYRMNRRGEWELAPVYDLTFNTGLNGHHQMDIEEESLRSARKHLFALGKIWDYHPASARKPLMTLLG